MLRLAHESARTQVVERAAKAAVNLFGHVLHHDDPGQRAGQQQHHFERPHAAGGQPMAITRSVVSAMAV